jgi:hypothetical protein
MRTRIQFQRAALAIGLLGTSVALAADQPTRFQNIHVQELPVRLALTRCYDGAPTCRGLIDTIESSTTIVIVRVGYCKAIAGIASSCLHFMADAGEFRYLRITLDPVLRGDTLVGMLAHELQHAVEIIRAPDVTDSHSLRALYTRIGYRLDVFGRGNEWETIEARQIANLVEGELKDARRTQLQARSVGK